MCKLCNGLLIVRRVLFVACCSSAVCVLLVFVDLCNELRLVCCLLLVV